MRLVRWFRCRFGCQVVALCIVWYTISSAAGIVNKLTLQRYPYPMTVALSSLCSIPLYASPLLRLWSVKNLHIPVEYMRRYVIPIAAGKALAVACAYFSLWKVPVSYAHTVKATMPIFAMLSARCVLGERASGLVYLSLLPIVAGVLIASYTELSFDLLGFLSALLSTATYSLLNVFVKRVLKDTDVHPIRLLALNSQIAAVIFFPFWLFRDGYSIWNDVVEGETHTPDGRFLLYLLVSGLLSFGQNLCAFTLIHRLTALSYAVTNAAKRITVISSSLLTLRNPVTPLNVFGMAMSIVGVFCYNRAKQAQKQSQGLPFTRTTATLSDASLVMLMNGSLSGEDSGKQDPRAHPMRASRFLYTDDVDTMIGVGNGRPTTGLNGTVYMRSLSPDSQQTRSPSLNGHIRQQEGPFRPHVRFVA